MGKNVAGKRDGTGPYKNSNQAKTMGIGKRKAAGANCPRTKNK